MIWWLLLGILIGLASMFLWKNHREKEAYKKGMIDACSVKLGGTKIISEHRYIPTLIKACVSIPSEYFISDADYSMNWAKEMLGRDLGCQAIQFARIVQTEEPITRTQMIEAAVYMARMDGE